MSGEVVGLLQVSLGALIAGGMALLTQRFERVARRDEHERAREAQRKDMLMKAAVELAALRTNSVIEVWKGAEMKMKLEAMDPINLTEVYYRQLSHLHAHGELPEDAYWDMSEEEKAALKGRVPFKSERVK